MVDKKRIGKAVSWNAVELLVRNGLNFVVLVVLARLLTPTDFGLVAMLAIFVAVADLLIDSGFSQALIQRQNATHEDESTIFFVTLGLGAGIAILLVAIAPWVAAFYEQPILQVMTYWMALNLFLNAFRTIHTTLLTKELDFKTITKTSVLSSLLAGAAAIWMAASGWGVWSLVGQILAATTASVILLWLWHPWRPQWVFRLDTLRSYFKFGGFLLWTGLLNTLYTNLYALLIGKMHSVQDAGLYSQARRLEHLPVNIITNIVRRVSFPVFAKVAEDKAKLARGLAKATTGVVFVTLPAMACLLVLAEPLILLLMGEKWLVAAPILQALALAGIMTPLNGLNLNVLKAQGHSALNARIQIIRLTIALGLLFAASPFGIVAIAYGQALASFLSFFVNSHYTKIHLDYGALAQLKDIVPYMLGGLVMVSVMEFVVFFAGLMGGGSFCWQSLLEWGVMHCMLG